MRDAALRCQLERPVDPTLDLPTMWTHPPHPGAEGGLQRKQAVGLRALIRVEWAVERSVHCGPKRLAVVPKCLRTADLTPETRALALVVQELGGASKELDSLVHLVAPAGKHGGT